MHIARATALFFLVATGFVFAKPQQVVLSAGNKVTVYRLNAETGMLTATQEVDLPGAGPFTASTDRKFLYVRASLPVAGEKHPQPAIATFSLLPKGKIVHRHTATIRGGKPGYLDISQNGKFIAGNSYRDGTAAVWKTVDGIYQGETVQVLQLEKKAHSTIFSPSNKWLLVPATEPNKVFVNKVNLATGELTASHSGAGPSAEGSAQQPRHLVFHPKLPIAYTTNEREEPGVGAWQWNETTGSIKTIQDIPTKPKDYEGRISTADLHLTPDARFLYASNRDIGAQGKDAIVAFSVQKDGTLEFIDRFKCEHIPRSFHVGENGKYVFVAGQKAAKLGVYKINRKNGHLKPVAQYDTGAGPNWVECLSW